MDASPFVTSQKPVRFESYDKSVILVIASLLDIATRSPCPHRFPNTKQIKEKKHQF